MNKAIRLRFREVRPEGKSAIRLLLLFQVLSLALVFLFRIQEITPMALFFAGGLIFSSFFSTWLINRISTGDPYPLVIAHMIFSIGVIMIYRIRPDLGLKQMLFYLIALLAYFLFYFLLRRFPHFWASLLSPYFFLTLACFVITLVFGHSLYGAKNWIRIGSIQLQPSEFSKLPFIFLIAGWFRRYEDFQGSLLKKLSLTLASFFLIGLFFIQKELGTAMVFFAVLVITQVAYERHAWIPLMNFLLALIGLWVAYLLFPYIRDRFSLWLDPWADANNKGYQIIQAFFALAAGSFFGTGLGLGQPGRIPLGHSDFIFAAIVEEFGSIMGICLILLFILLLYRGFKAAMRQDRDFYAVLALGVVILFAAQAFLMFAGTMSLIPLTGITIPFLTYGGSSLISSFLLLAVLQVASESMNQKEG